VWTAFTVVDVLELHAHARHVGAAALAVLVLAVVVGCGSGDGQGSPEAAWADGFCSSLSTWRTSVQSAASSVKDVNQLSKAKLQTAAASVAAANAQLVADVKGLGTPPKSAGDQAKNEVDDLAGKLQVSADKVKDATADIGSVQEAVTAANVASAALLEMSADISATLSSLETVDAADAWKSAFSDSKACQSLSKT
jgi:type I site-specific restriction endonuclease